MVYNSYLHTWLPVNDKGVTDQAVMQAYEKDKGKLDKSSLSQGLGPVESPDQDLFQLQIEAFELGVNPFTGEPVTDDYTKMMISSLKWSQIVAGIGMVAGSMKNGKGPYKGRGTNAILDKVKQTIRDAKAKRESLGNATKDTGKTFDNIKGLDDILNDPSKLKGVKPEELYKYLKDNGYNQTPLNKSRNYTGVPFEEGGGFKVNWGGDRILQYHPGSSYHGDVPYYKISSGSTGTQRFDMKGNLLK